MSLCDSFPRFALFTATTLLAGGLAFGCSSSKSNPASAVDSGVNDMDGMSMGDGDMPVSCGTDSRVATYSDGLTKMGQGHAAQVKFVSAHPAPPARGDNSWDIQLLDGSGNPLDARLELALDMPDHGHTSPAIPVIQAGATTGSYAITNVDLFMPGVWRVQLSISAANADAGAIGTLLDIVTIYFCIEG